MPKMYDPATMTVFDAREDEDDEPRQPRCKQCGDTEVRWRQQGGKWVLFSMQPGVEHMCKIDDSDFDVVPE